MTERPDPPTFNCPSCGTVSHHPQDVKHGYCGRCRRFTRAEANAGRALGGLEDARHHADGLKSTQAPSTSPKS